MILDVIHDFCDNVLEKKFTPRVCGGAIRDFIIGKPINDIDMYLHERDYGTISMILKRKNIFWKNKTNNGNSSYINKNIVGVYSLPYNTPKGPQDFDLIFVNDNSIQGILDTYDNNLCMFSYNVSVRGLYIRECAVQDWKNKTITKNPKVSRKCWEHSKRKHIPKMMAKFHDYNVIEADRDITNQFNIPRKPKIHQISTPKTVYKKIDPDTILNDGEYTREYTAPIPASELYCGCATPIITHNEAWGKPFKYCKACCKEKQ